MIKVYVMNTDVNRDFHYLWKQIIEQLTLHPLKLDIISEPLTECGDSLLVNINDFTNLQIFDCELLIEYDGKFKALSMMDYHSQLSEFFSAGLRNNKQLRSTEDTFLISQIKSPHTIWDDYLLNKVTCKVSGGIYTPQLPFIDFEIFRNKRFVMNKLDKFVFKGNVGSLPRTVIKFLENSEYYSGSDTYNPMEYFENIIKYKVGLCIPGAGEICHRDIEYMAIGIPMLKFEYMSNLTPPLIPNFHYISIPRIDNNFAEGERSGGQEYADLYIQRFLEVKDDLEFLEFVSKNAMEYYDKYLHPSSRIKHIFDLWELPFHVSE